MVTERQRHRDRETERGGWEEGRWQRIGERKRSGKGERGRGLKEVGMGGGGKMEDDILYSCTVPPQTGPEPAGGHVGSRE